jgi:hypothetical protein
MRLSAGRIRSINRSIAPVNGIICGASDTGEKDVTLRLETVLRQAGKHTVGEQLLDVRRDKRERAAFAAAEASGRDLEEEEEDDEVDDKDDENEGPSLADLEELDGSSED